MINNNDLLYQIALTLTPHIGDVHTKTLVHFYGSAEAVFKARKKELEQLDGIGTIRASSIKSFQDYSTAESEIKFIEKYKIQPLFIADKAYPQRLLNCYDSPALLYYRGTADLNHSKILSVVGTRNNSIYGKNCTEAIIEALSTQSILIVSGLALGIDSIAHKAALKNDLSTVGVLAHGLDTIYPPQNKSLAKQMVDQGGLLTEFRSTTNPDKQNFPRRNRIVAGICDGLLIVESSQKGGSLITAELANGYNKDVFAIPGKTTDTKSEGCNQLIKQNKAMLVSGASDIVEMLNWVPKEKPSGKKQRSLFVELSDEEKKITSILELGDAISVDELYLRSGLSNSKMAAALLQLELQHIVECLPGKLYRML